ncbi:hypothetical protein PLESTB_001369300 [Pleodorina starrii]|uniref:Uncharacterized protein n=1 Tax=Pleodorina starrii TaxID=330485 RepID=A0A9W6F7C8_9CHLO|nr:hypothetical protein PLESTM_000415700 [Pleodorina starrii]GLC58515.1 hypothetical protein PLESTB_001369300 [Pleodorina starrii]
MAHRVVGRANFNQQGRGYAAAYPFKNAGRARSFPEMAALKVTFTAAAVAPDCRPSLPRSGACAVSLPSWHPHEVILLGGYTEDRGDRPRGDQPGVRAAGTPAVPKDPAPAPSPSPPRRAPTIEAWTFSSEDGGRWHRVDYAEGTPLPQPRLTCQAAVVGDELWLLGGWDPSAAAAAAAAGGGAASPQFLNDVWSLHLRTYTWRRVEVAGEELQPISRFALAPLPDGRLLLHTHRCDEHVLQIDPRVGAGAGGVGAEPADAGPAAAPPLPPRPVLSKVAVHGTDAGTRSPPSRGLHSLTLAAPPTGASTPGEALYVYGGAPQSGPMYGDLWVLDTGAMTWRQLTPEGPMPQARCSHVAGACAAGGDVASRYLLLAGGSYYVQPGQLKPLDDVILYDTQTNRWIEPEVEGPRPSPRNAAILAPLRRNGHGGGGGGGDRFVLHGGWRPFVETYDDTYIVTVTSAAAAAEGGGRQ